MSFWFYSLRVAISICEVSEKDNIIDNSRKTNILNDISTVKSRWKTNKVSQIDENNFSIHY